MRVRKEKKGVSVHAIAGTRVVLLGLNATEQAAKGLLGFSIYKRKGRSGKEQTLGGGKIFAGVHADNARVRSDKAPIQGFMWSDYAAEPDTSYTYRVVPQYGEPGALEAGEEVKVTVRTEDPDDGTHAVHFNRGVAGSRAFSRLFGKYRRWYLAESKGRIRAREFVKPEVVRQEKKADEPDAYEWLSRGLEEAMLDFIGQAKGPKFGLRAAVYEFTYLPAIQAFIDALERGADVKIVHHAKRNGTYLLKMHRNPKDGTTNWRVNTTTTWESGDPAPKTYKNRYVLKELDKDGICKAAEKAVGQIGLTDERFFDEFDQLMIERTVTQIHHNKFIVLLEDDKPTQVWTGSTNFTAGGIFGQSNVGHVVRDEKIARKYLEYWKLLAADTPKAEMTKWTARNTPDIKKLPREAIVPIFSPRPRKKETMLDWYADRIEAAKNSVFFTAAFSVDQRFLDQFQSVKQTDGTPYQRYILLESKSGKMWDKYRSMAKVDQNRIAWGDVLKPRDGEDDEGDEHAQFIETLTGLNDHVEYLHTKFMLIDPLSDDPLVISGSANFSENSTIANDENMLVIRGNTRVADIFLGEFMRIFNHFESRNKRNAMSDERLEKSSQLVPNDSWTRPFYKEGSPDQQERLLFA